MPRPTLFEHPKFNRLVHLLGLPEPYVLGHLEYLWRVGYASGNPVIGDELDVEIAAKWQGERGKFCNAVTDVRFIDRLADGRYAIHDLAENAPEYVTSRNRRETERAKEKRCGHCSGVFHSPDARAKYCTKACKTAHWRETNERPKTFQDVSGRTKNLRKRSVTLRNETVTLRDPPPAPAPTPTHSVLSSTTSTTPSQTTHTERPRENRASEGVLPPMVPVELAEMWNELTGPKGLPSCSTLSAKRLASTLARLREQPSREYWQRVIAGIVASPFCLGDGATGWRADFDWLIRPDTALKVLEGKYSGQPRAPASRARTAENASAKVRALQDELRAMGAADVKTAAELTTSGRSGEG